MVVYADVLMAVNLIVDYFLLKISGKILNFTPKLWRMILAAVLGAVFSLYIFFPQGKAITELTVKILMSSVMVLVSFGFKNLKFFLKAFGTFFIVTCLYAGIMIALWQTLKPKGMVINNSVVYFNISPVALVFATVLGYLIYILCSKIFASSAKFAQKCEIKISVDNQNAYATAIIDTGNSISDLFSKSEIIIADESILILLFGTTDKEKNPKLIPRYRAIPCSTVSGHDILDGFRCDSAVITYQNKIINIEKPIVAISKNGLKEDYSAIINPKIIGEKNDKTQKLSV